MARLFLRSINAQQCICVSRTVRGVLKSFLSFVFRRCEKAGGKRGGKRKSPTTIYGIALLFPPLAPPGRIEGEGESQLQIAFFRHTPTKSSFRPRFCPPLDMAGKILQKEGGDSICRTRRTVFLRSMQYLPLSLLSFALAKEIAQ